MKGRGGIGRVVLVALLVMVLIGLGVRSLVSRTVDRAQPDADPGQASTRTDVHERSLAFAPDGGDPGAPRPPRSTGGSPTSPTPARLRPVPGPLTPAELDDPRRTPFAPGTEPLPPPEYDPSAPVAHRGTLPAMVIQDVVRESLPELRYCFEWQLGQHPELAGRVTMELTIAEDGTVVEPRVIEDALHDETVTRCFTHVIAGLHFPPPEGGSVLVRYPFTLANSPEASRPEGI